MKQDKKMSGWLGDLSKDQQESLNQLKNKLSQAEVLQQHHDDRFLLRWLRARDFDVEKSGEMLRNSLDWRVQTGADKILETFTPPEVLTKYYPGGFYGQDKGGSPIYIETVGYADMKGLFHSIKKSDFIKYKIRSCELNGKYIAEQNAKLGRDVKGIVIIFDMQHYGLKHLYKPALDAYTEVISIFQNHYPEMLKKTYIVNEPRLLSVFVKIIKPFISENTRKKIVVCGADWKQKLLEDIDADQLPVHWGGTATVNGDLHCGVCMGGEVPKKYYLDNISVDMTNFKTVAVRNRSRHLVPIEVKETGAIIKWQFQTDSRDIKYCLMRRSKLGQSLNEMEVVVPLQKVNSNLVMEDGDFTCEQPCTYVLVFDNSYSMLTSKKVAYNFEILPPCEEGRVQEILTS